MARIVTSLLLPSVLCTPLLALASTPSQGAAGARAKLVVGETHAAELPSDGDGTVAAAEWELVAEASETVTVALESYDFDAFVAVRAPDGATVEADLGGLGTDARATLDVAAGATYVVRVERRAGNGGAYTLHVERGLPALPQGVERQAAELAYWDEAAQRAHERGDARRELLGLRVAAHVEIVIGRPRAAVERLRRGLALAEQVGEHGETLFARAQLGRELQVLGATDEALPLLERSRTDLAPTGLHDLLADVQLGLGEVYLARGELDEAEAILRQALDLVRERGAAAMEPYVMERLADVLGARGELDQALEMLERQTELARALGSEEHAAALVQRAAFLERYGELDSARDAALGALELAADGGRVQADAIGALGSVEEALGHLAAARTRYAEVLLRAEALGDEVLTCLALGRLAAIARQLGQHDRARELIEEALAREPDEAVRVGLWNELGVLHDARGDHAQCIAAHERALAIARSSARVDDEVRTLLALANARQRQGELDEARAHAETAQMRAQGCLRGDLTALTEINLGYLDLLSGSPVEARARSERALQRLGHNAGARTEMAALETIARASIALGDIEPTRAAVRRALTLLEAPTQDLGIEDASGWRASHAWWAGALQQDLTELVVSTPGSESQTREREIELGFEACGTWKQRALREILSRRRSERPTPAASVSAGEARAAVLGPDSVLIEYATGSESLFAYVLTQDTLELVELGARAPLEKLVGDYLVAISEPAALGTAPVIARIGHALYQGLLAPVLDALGGLPETLIVVPTTALAGLPFEALVSSLEVPADRVRDLTQVEFVLDRHLIAYAPSTPVLVELASCTPHARSGRALLLGDPLYPRETTAPDDLAMLYGRSGPDELNRLIGTREEAFTLASLLLAESDAGTDELQEAMEHRTVELESESFRLCLGAEANASRLLSGLDGYGVLHVGAHGFVDPVEPRNTGIALAGPDGFVSIGDVALLELDLDLAVLSACQTALGPIQNGEGIQSLANAFLRAGARSVVASLWQVRDLETASLMRDFYRAWLRDELTPARALRAAKLTLRAAEPTLRAAESLRGRPVDDLAPQLPSGHPYFWASCVYVGLPGAD